MASTSNPTADALRPLPLALGPNRALHVLRGQATLRSARAADGLTRRLGVATSRHPGVDPSWRVTLPFGVWTRTGGDADDTADAALRALGPALAQYAARLRSHRATRREPTRRGLPVLARRGGATSYGDTRGPGGLARACIATDHETPAIDAVRARRSTPERTAPVEARTPAPSPPAPRPSRGDDRRAGRPRPRRKG